MNKVKKYIYMIEKYLVNAIVMIDKKKTNMKWNILCDYILLGYNNSIYIMGFK